MSGPTPVEMLEAEHRVIQRMVAGMSVLADQIESGEEVDVSLLESIVTSSARLLIAATMVRKKLSCSRPWYAVECRHTAVQ